MVWNNSRRVCVSDQYGGPLGVGRELVFNAKGSLGVRPLTELITAIRKPSNNAKLFDCAETLSGKWKIDAAKQEFILRMNSMFEEGRGQTGVIIGTVCARSMLAVRDFRGLSGSYGRTVWKTGSKLGLWGVRSVVSR